MSCSPMKQVQCVALFLLASTSGVAAAGVRGASAQHHHTQEQIVDSSPAPPPNIETTETTAVDMEVKNMDYMSMTKPWQDPHANGNPNDWMMEMDHDAPKHKQKKSKKSSGGSADIHQGPEKMADAMDNTLNNVLDGGLAGPGNNADGAGSGEEDGEDSGLGELPSLPWPAKGGAFVQLDKRTVAREVAMQLSGLGPMTVQKALKASVEGAIKSCLPCSLSSSPAPAPAPLPAPAVVPLQPPSGMLPSNILPSSPAAAVALVQNIVSLRASAAAGPAAGPAPGPASNPSPAPGPASACPRPKVHVEVLPGKKMKKRHMINKPASGAAAVAPQTTLIRITLFERPGNGIDDTAGLKTQLKTLMHTGVLKASLEVAIEAVTGVKPKLGHLKVHARVVPLWDVQKCGSHMSNLVKSFTVHYTRRQVPMALYNECTSFMTKMSFSHDYILDHRDAAHCRQATQSFAQRWKMGKKDEPKDFEKMCGKFCQAKYGNDSPQCHFA